MPRFVLALVGVATVIVLGAIQFASSAAWGDLAAAPSLPAALHAASPRLLRRFAGDARARAAAAIYAGDLDDAAALVAALPPGAATDDLRGELAQARGDAGGAIAAYVRAGDAVRAQTLIDALAQRDPEAAYSAQRALVEGLAGDAGAAEVTGQAWWRLGELQALLGYRDAARRASLWRDAQASYERALASAPNEETYLLAAGYQALANGDRGAAQRRYRRAADVVPDSADAYAGLAWTAAARGECAVARDALARARALAHAPGRDPVDDPNVGAALRRCTT